MSQPLVSVLMPAYNHEAYVRSAVESVLGQTWQNLELIIIDDASLDGTWNILQEFDDDRIRLSRHETNRGAHATLNEAMALARGAFIAIINSDDVYTLGRITRLMERAAANPEQDVFIFTEVDFIDGKGDLVADHPRAVASRDLRSACETLSEDVWFLAGNPAITTSNFFFSKALAEKVGAFSPLRYTHDWDWVLRAQASTSPIWLKEPLLQYRVHAANTLSEDDVWRHIHENSFIQARALLAREQVSEPENAGLQTCLALLENDSFHPVALLVYVIYRLVGVPVSRLQDLTSGQESPWLMQRIAEKSAISDVVFHSMRRLSEREDVIDAQEQLVQERFAIIQRMDDALRQKDTVIASQAALVEERFDIIQEMKGEIASRDEVIASQATLVEERFGIIQEMTCEIANRDEVIASQAALVEERFGIIQKMSREIASRDQAIASQAELIEQRWGVIQSMNVEIANRDKMNEVLSQEKDELERTLASMYRSSLVRLALFLKKRIELIRQVIK